MATDGRARIEYSRVPEAAHKGISESSVSSAPLQMMRLELCEALMAVASERPTKAQHAQELEMSIYEASPTKVRACQGA